MTDGGAPPRGQKSGRTPAVAISLPQRRCYRCRETLAAEDFAIDRSKGSGRKSICKRCDRARAAARYASRSSKGGSPPTGRDTHGHSAPRREKYSAGRVDAGIAGRESFVSLAKRRQPPHDLSSSSASLAKRRGVAGVVGAVGDPPPPEAERGYEGGVFIL